MTCLAYLAEPTRGGRTVFPKLGVGFDPRVGGEFLFISAWAIGMTSCFVFVYSVAGGRPGDVVGKRGLRATGTGTAGFVRHADGG